MSGCLSPALPLAPARHFAARSRMPVPHSTSSWWRACHFLSLFSIHFLMPSYCVSSHGVCTSSSLAILSTFWCSCTISRACCLTVLSIRLLQSPGALDDAEISLLNLFPSLFRSHSSLTAVIVTRVVSPDTSPAMLLVCPASAILISLLIGCSPIVPLTGLPPSWVAIMASSLVIASRLSCRHSVVAVPGLLLQSSRGAIPGSIRCQESNANVRLLLTIVVAELFRRFCFAVFVSPLLFSIFRQAFPNALDCVVFCARVLQLPCPASSNRPEVLEVPFRGQFEARNGMPVSACRSLSWLLSCFAVSVFAKTFSLAHVCFVLIILYSLYCCCLFILYSL